MWILPPSTCMTTAGGLTSSDPSRGGSTVMADIMKMSVKTLRQVSGIGSRLQGSPSLSGICILGRLGFPGQWFTVRTGISNINFCLIGTIHLTAWECHRPWDFGAEPRAIA